MTAGEKNRKRRLELGITKDGANVSFARMETIKAWVAHCLTRQRMLSKHGTNDTKRTEHGQKTRQLYIPTILL